MYTLIDSDYSHEYTYPKGNWSEFAIQTYKFSPSSIALRTTFFPNPVCAFFYLNKTTKFLKYFNSYHTTYYYNEDCIEYDIDDHLTVVDGKFKK